MTLTRRQLLIFGSGLVAARRPRGLVVRRRQAGGHRRRRRAQAAAADLSTLLDPPALGATGCWGTDAPVTVVEYASATCPHCAAFHKNVFPELKKTYIDTGKVRFIFREFPHDQLALAAFMLARCAPRTNISR